MLRMVPLVHLYCFSPNSSFSLSLSRSVLFIRCVRCTRVASCLLSFALLSLCTLLCQEFFDSSDPFVSLSLCVYIWRLGKRTSLGVVLQLQDQRAAGHNAVTTGQEVSVGPSGEQTVSQTSAPEQKLNGTSFCSVSAQSSIAVRLRHVRLPGTTPSLPSATFPVT